MEKQWQIHKVTARETMPLRHSVLRPHQPMDETIYPGDDHEDSLHVGAFIDHRLIGVGSIFHQDHEGLFGRGVWRIRGMAVLSEFRGLHVGNALLLKCLDHARSFHSRYVWCNARVEASEFYVKQGFVKDGDVFELKGIGPHYLLKKSLSGSL